MILRRTLPATPVGLLVLLAILMTASGCGAADGDTATVDEIVTNDGNTVTGPDDVPDLAFTDPDRSLDERGLGGQGEDGTGTSGLAPVTTIPGLADPGSLVGYTGVLGYLDPSEPVIDAATAPPTGSDDTFPLTGMPGVAPDRPAAVVKIDNGSAAVPQTGLNDADIVIEEEVEGGVTRLAAIFHSKATVVGPVRSGRTTDVALIGSLGSPLFLYSGANDMTEAILRRQPHVQNHSHNTTSGYWRDDTRDAPSNLYTDTGPHWAGAEGDAPPPQFAYRVDGASVSGTPADGFAVNYPASNASWQWDGGQWIRSQRGKRHEVVGGEPVSAANVVVIEAQRVGTGMFDSAGGPVPEFVFVGQGPVTVFTEGRRIEGVWTKPSLLSVATLTDLNGRVIELTPGRTWIQLVEQNSGYLQ